MTRVCRVCLHIIINAECYSLNQSYPNSECTLLRDRCKVCIPEMDLNLTNDAVLCGSCYGTFTLFHHFRQKCLDTEKKLRNILRQNNYVDLIALAKQSQITVDTIPYSFDDVASVSSTGNCDEPVIKQECEEVAEDVGVFDRATNRLEADKTPDLNDNVQEDKSEDLIKLNGSVHSAGSSDFIEDSCTKYNSKKKEFKCLDCDYSTSHRINLQSHIKSHFGNKPYKCSLCGYRALQKCFLKSHMTIHSGTKPFKCSQCDYKTAYRGNLQTHLRKHTGEKPYKCDICNNSYTQSNSLNRHIKSHANIKPFKCYMCDYRTLYKSHLRNHMMLHTGEKSFPCNTCNQKFTRKSDLTIHMKEHSFLTL